MTRNADSGTRSGDGPAGYAFAGFTLDLRRMGVWKEGTQVPIEPKSFDLLWYLIDHRDRLVPYDELLDAVWSGTFVTPNALTRAVARLRKALGDASPDASPDGTIVQTVSKRGYRFVAPVSPIAPPADELESRPTRRMIPGHLTPAAAALAMVLAVGAGIWWAIQPGGAAPRADRPLRVATLTASGNVIHAAITPDGETIAYVESSGGLQALWLRQTDGAHAIALVAPAPVEYWGVTIAPDARSVYYVVKGAAPYADPAGTLFRVPLLGGASVKLGTGYDSPVAIARDGLSIAYLRAGHPEAGASALMIARVDGAGARPLAVRRVPEAFAPAFYAAPSWSPRGDRIAVPIRDVEAREARLAIVDVETGRVSVFPDAFSSLSFTAWPDGGGILFAGRAPGKDPGLGGRAQIWRQPLPGGRPAHVTADIVDYRSLSVTADGTKLASVGMTNASAMWLVPLGAGAPRRIAGTLRTDAREGVSWLDRDTFVFTSPVGSTQQIWRTRADGGDRRALTAEGSSAWPRPSPDGEWVYLTANDGAEAGLWRMRPDGTGRRIVARVRNASRLSVSPDGATVFFTALAGDLPSTWKVSAAGGTPELVVPGLADAVVSRDGRRLAGFWREAVTAGQQLAVFPAGGGAPTHVFEERLGTDHIGGVWWTVAGDAVLFTTKERANVWRQALAGGAPVRVTDLPDGAIVRGDLSPDGRALLALRGVPVRDVYLLQGF
jgi:DNA-binding winged helix-turn-helix (wHTH) protein/Tol biopolymer transport system component